MEVRSLPQAGAYALEGELDMATVDGFLAGLRDAPQDGDLVLNVSNLTFVDSLGLRAILRVARGRNHGSSVVLKDPTPSVMRLLSIALPGGAPGVRVDRSADV